MTRFRWVHSFNQDKMEMTSTTCYIFNIKKLLDEHIQVQNTFIRKWLWFIIRNKIMLFYWYIPLRPLNRLHQYWLHPTTKYPQKYNVSHFLSLPNLVYTDNLCDPDIRYCPKTQFILYMLQMYFIETSFMHFIERRVK